MGEAFRRRTEEEDGRVNASRQAIGPFRRVRETSPAQGRALCSRAPRIFVDHGFNRSQGIVRRTRCAAIDNCAIGHRSQPSQLALAELARGENAFVAHRRVVDFAV